MFSSSPKSQKTNCSSTIFSLCYCKLTSLKAYFKPRASSDPVPQSNPKLQQHYLSLMASSSNDKNTSCYIYQVDNISEDFIFKLYIFKIKSDLLNFSSYLWKKRHFLMLCERNLKQFPQKKVNHCMECAAATSLPWHYLLNPHAPLY